MKENINKEIQKCDVDTQEIEKELEEIRENGYSFRDTISENVPGGMAIACPIFNGSGVMLAVLSVIGFPGSLNTDPDSKEVKKIKEIASDLVKELH